MDQLPKVHVSFEEKLSWLNVADELPKKRGKTDESIEDAGDIRFQ